MPCDIFGSAIVADDGAELSGVDLPAASRFEVGPEDVHDTPDTPSEAAVVEADGAN